MIKTGWLIFFFVPFVLFAQQDTVKGIDVDFLFNYYEQDGNHSAVTGGRGTQELQDIAGKIVLKVVMDSVSTLFTTVGINRYSSASTDRIDSRLSSASAEDFHAELSVGYEKKKNKKLSTGGSFYGAIESDYISMGMGYNLKRKEVKHGTYSLNLMGYYDSWIVIYPEELRRKQFRMAPTDKRYTLSLTQSYSWFMSKRISAAITLDLTWQNGLLATPFHRVYFKDTTAVSIEQLPQNRIKVPLGFELNYYLTDRLILKTNSRLYTDNFGINSITFDVNPVILLSNSLSVTPFYRYYLQSGSKHFNYFAQNEFLSDYYTSDYDLSGFNSKKYGVMVKYHPLYGVLGKNRLGLKNVGLRYSQYSRSDGLAASIVGFNCGFGW